MFEKHGEFVPWHLRNHSDVLAELHTIKSGGTSQIERKYGRVLYD